MSWQVFAMRMLEQALLIDLDKYNLDLCGTGGDEKYVQY
jgi:anthranilate phosphoribosyltransferase